RDQFPQCLAHILFGETREIDGEFGRMGRKTFPMPGPEERLRIVDGECCENSAAVEHCRRDGSNSRLRRFDHRSVEVDDRMHRSIGLLVLYVLYHLSSFILFPLPLLQLQASATATCARQFLIPPPQAR